MFSWKKDIIALVQYRDHMVEQMATRLDALEKGLTTLDRKLAILETRPPIPGTRVVVEGGSLQPKPPAGGVAEWLPVIDRFQELALVAMQHPDLAQQFGLTTRQKERDAGQPEVGWTEPEEPGEGITYG